MSYRLSTRADADLIAIYEAGAELFGSAQAESYVAGLRATIMLIAKRPGPIASGARSSRRSG